MSIRSHSYNIVRRIYQTRKISVRQPSKNLIPDDIYSKNLHGNRLLANELRLLYLLPNKDPQARIEGLLTRGALDLNLHYAALSYTCGNPFSPSLLQQSSSASHSYDMYDQTRKDHTIILNGIQFQVSLNLYEGLSRLRNVKRPHGLWVDAICINQGDPTEIAQQVQNMGAIFHRAHEVLIWLGEAESTNQLKNALHLVDDIYYAFKKWYDNQFSQKFDETWEHINKETEDTPDSEDQKHFWEWLKNDGREWVAKTKIKEHLSKTGVGIWRDLENLLSRAWFDRVWTWQEKELARTARVYVGNKSVSWRRLRFAMLLVMAHDQARLQRPTEQLMPGRQYLHVVDNLNIDQKPDLLDIVMNVRHRDCYNKLDKIFGVLGAAEGDETNRDAAYFLEKVDYNERFTTVPKLYTEFSRYYIQDQCDLRVLQACNPRTSGTNLALPSWVADWTDIMQSHQLSSYIYNAADGTKVEADYDPINQEMRLGGFLLDRVTVACHDERIDELELLVDESIDWDFWREEIISTYVSLYIYGCYRGDHQQMKRYPFYPDSCWSALINYLRQVDTYAPTGEPISEAFWRCLMVDKKPGTKMDKHRRIDANINVTKIFQGTALDRVLDPVLRRQVERQFRQTSAQRKDTEEEEKHLPGWFSALQRTVLRKRFFLTEGGLFGMAPSNLRTGDMVTVLRGGRVPFLLRQKQDHYQLIEEAYVHGYMDGQAVKYAEQEPGKWKEFNLR